MVNPLHDERVSLDKRTRDLRLFLDFLYSNIPEDSYIGLTTIKKSTKEVANYFFKPTELDRLVHRIETREDKYNVFVRVPPLAIRPEVGRGTADQSIGSNALWSDIDTPDKPRAIDALQLLVLPPSRIVDSGHGLHAYWKLQNFTTDLNLIKSKNRALQMQINTALGLNEADSVFDLARVMRVPGTWNVKNGSAKLVTIVFDDPTRIYSIDQFPDAPPIEHNKEIENWDTEEIPLDFIDILKERDKKLAQRILSEDGARKADAAIKPSGDVDTSRNDAFIATRLLALGYTPGIVLSVLSHDEWFSGKRFRETLRFDYVVRTTQRAWENYQRSPDRFFRGRAIVTDKLAEFIEQDQPFLYTASKLWIYHTGVFTDSGEDVVKKAIVKQLGSKWTSHAQNEVLQWLQAKYSKPVETVNNHTGLINCQNGMLDIVTTTLIEHSELYCSLSQIPVVYNSNADTSAIDAFFAQLLPVDAIPVFWEYVGSAFITNHYWPKKFALFLGPRDTGKSKILDLLIRFYGILNTATIDFQTLADQRFAKIELFGKLADIYDDLNENEAQNTGNIKTFTGDGYIAAERKYGGFISFKNTARLFFAANHHVPVKNPDDAYFSRVLVFPCTRQFTGLKADHTIVDKLSTPENLSAMLLRAVQGLRRLLHQNQLSTSQAMDTALMEYKFGADTVLGFFQATTIEDSEGRIPKEPLYSLYKTWCLAGSRRYFSSDKFYKRINEYMETLKIYEEYATVSDGVRKRCYIGRRLLQEVTTPVFVFSRN